MNIEKFKKNYSSESFVNEFGNVSVITTFCDDFENVIFEVTDFYKLKSKWSQSESGKYLEIDLIGNGSETNKSFENSDELSEIDEEDEEDLISWLEAQANLESYYIAENLDTEDLSIMERDDFKSAIEGGHEVSFWNGDKQYNKEDILEAMGNQSKTKYEDSLTFVY